eukprot:COSAG06_NODE_29715_length_551_cov_1.143805_2_plen_74_part_01
MAPPPLPEGALAAPLAPGPRARAYASCEAETVPRQRGGGGGAPRMSSKEAVLKKLDGAGWSAIGILERAPAALR